MKPSTGSTSTSPSPAEVMARLEQLNERLDRCLRVLAAEPQATAQRTQHSEAHAMKPITSTTDRPWGAAAWHRAKSQHPELTSYGFGTPPGLADAWREGLDPEDLQQIATCGLFLSGLQQIEPGRRCPGSYALKHKVERWAGRYVREGALIAAAVALEVPLKRHGREHHGVVLGLAAAPLAARLERPLFTITRR